MKVIHQKQASHQDADVSMSYVICLSDRCGSELFIFHKNQKQKETNRRKKNINTEKNQNKQNKTKTKLKNSTKQN